MILSDQQIRDIRRLLPDSAEIILQTNDVNNVLEALDELCYSLLDEEQEPTDESREVERLLDTIHWDNTH